MARIISDLKTQDTTVANKIIAAKSTAKPVRDAQKKIRIHITCIVVAGLVSTVLFQLKIGNPVTLGFGPVAPSIVQEIFDRIFRL